MNFNFVQDQQIHFKNVSQKSSVNLTILALTKFMIYIEN